MLTVPHQKSLFDERTPVANRRYRPDVCERKHGGAETSVAAHASGDKRRDRALALAFIADRGATGATADEFAAHVGRQLNQVSGRFSELKRDGQITATGEKRPTRNGSQAKVYVLTGEQG